MEPRRLRWTSEFLQQVLSSPIVWQTLPLVPAGVGTIAMPVLVCSWDSNMELGGGTPEKAKIHMHSVALEMYVFSIGMSFPRA